MSLGFAIALSGCATSGVAPELLRMTRTTPAEDSIAIRWIGTAGFEVRTANGTLLFDPFLTRPSFLAVAGARLASDEALLAEALPTADLILIGHSHYDHLMDAPAIARRTGALIAGSPTTCFAARAMGIGEATCRSDRSFKHGPFEVRAIPSRHALAPIVGVPVPGFLARTPSWRWPHAAELPMGGAIIWVVRTSGMTIVHLSSASLPADPTVLPRLVPEGADVVLASIAIRSGTPGYARRLIAELRPRVIIPSHHDPLFGRLEPSLPSRSQEELDRFVEEARGAEVMILAPFEERSLRKP